MNAVANEVANKMFPDLNQKLNNIRKSSETLTVKNGVIQLNPNNASHRKWFENDEDYDI
jgi:hypothetical protein